MIAVQTSHGETDDEQVSSYGPRITLKATRHLNGYSVGCEVNAMPGESDTDAYQRLVQGMTLLETKYPAKKD